MFFCTIFLLHPSDLEQTMATLHRNHLLDPLMHIFSNMNGPLSSNYHCHTHTKPTHLHYKKETRDNITLQRWLNIKHFIKSMGDKSEIILSSASNDIINAFGGIKKVVECLINNGNKTQLKLILDVIKKKKD